MTRKLLFISLLLYTLPGLSAVIQRSNTDDLEFSSDGGATYTYTPVPDADGYDSNVTHFRGLTGGAFAASNGVSNPSFSFQFRVRVQ